MEFKKYQHIKRYGDTEVEGIEIGECFIFHKIDGTNGSVWLNKYGEIKAGSRNRELSLDKDNKGFYAYVLQNENIKSYLRKHPTHRLYGEWLVPHSLKTYRDDAWRKFYIFDVCVDKEDGGIEYLHYNVYKPLLEEFNLNYIPPIARVVNGDYEQFVKFLDNANFLVEDGKGKGEGIVIKRYDFYNQFGRQVWAKIVSNEFREKHAKTMGVPKINNQTIEEKILDEFCTTAFIEKEFAKLVNQKDEWDNKYIPELFGRIWYEFVNEESWNIVKKYKNPTINYKRLNNLLIQKIKRVKSELFK